jgi:uncharacterized protein YggE
MKETRLIAVLLLSAVSASSLHAQEHGEGLPAISVGATGRVEIAADFAVLTLGVHLQDSTPTLAATGMDNRIGRVIDALMTLGFPPESLPTAHYHVTPNRGHDRLRIIGYDANSAVRVTVWDLATVPAVIEAALAAGATDATGLQFGASDEREARDEALKKAIAEARRDAEVIAEAAGGRLGPLLEVSTQSSNIRQARAMEFSGVGAPGPQITPRNITVVANVSVRWAFQEY